ncbi:MAG TPA: hypothetical protein VNX25_05880, partial [Verrucomicrobiae bacterium]|nr:hypothetical protein [Verrucomicrobiae bacterium]
ARLLLVHLPQIICYDAASVLLACLRGRAAAALRARLHVLRDLPKLLAKRREVRRLRRISVQEAESLLSPQPSALQTFFRKMGSGV